MALPPIQQTQPKPSVIVVASPTQPLERKRHEPTRSPGIDTQTIRDEPGHRTRHDPETPDTIRQPPVVVPTAPTPEQKEFAEPNKKSSVEPTKTIRKPDENNSETIHPTELFEPDKPASQAGTQDFKKVGKVVGRQRRYDDLGENEIEPIRELFLLRHLTGKHWPGLSKDMEAYYEKFYFTRPKKGSKDYAKHVKCWERRTRWIAEHTA